jgi:hypothetical protein
MREIAMRRPPIGRPSLISWISGTRNEVGKNKSQDKEAKYHKYQAECRGYRMGADSVLQSSVKVKRHPSDDRPSPPIVFHFQTRGEIQASRRIAPIVDFSPQTFK